ncbi:MAG: terpene cyclase/mutase family protein [Bryobacterales bacterium]|nr:terpene cyclase/mutase family protein [Bryobacterales bacterium]
MDVHQARLSRLRARQNHDGGWGYFPGKQSRLEPTCYALLALYGDRPSGDAWMRGWSLIRSWQQEDGGYRPGAEIQVSSWATALVVTLHCVHGTYDGRFQKAVAWLLGSRGIEGSWVERALGLVMRMPVEYDRRHKGWPWNTDTASWVEPTAHSVLALKKAAGKVENPALRERVTEGEKMMLDRRSPDGGWNYGNKRVMRTDLPSYPETTAVALLGLQGSLLLEDPNAAVAAAEKHWRETRSRLAKAWLTISLRNYGKDVPLGAEAEPDEDVMITALEALACPNGGHQWLKPA